MLMTEAVSDRFDHLTQLHGFESHAIPTAFANRARLGWPLINRTGTPIAFRSHASDIVPVLQTTLYRDVKNGRSPSY